MPAPSLKIPLSLDSTQFKQNIADAKSVTSTLTDFVLKQFAKYSLKLAVNSDGFKAGVQDATAYLGQQFDKVKPQIQSLTQEWVKDWTAAGIKTVDIFGGPTIKGAFQAFTSVGIPAAIGLTQALLPLIAIGVAVTESVKLIGDTIEAAAHQVQEMTEIAQKALDTGFSPAFWQSFTDGAKGATGQVQLFEDALKNAFDQLKPVLNPDWSVWDKGLTKVTDVETAMKEMLQLFSTDQDFSGFDLFKNAGNQDQQVAAILTYMKQLQGIGENVAALDLGDKLFGSSFTDKIRTGQVTVDDLLDDIKTKSANAFSDQLVTRAKDLNDQLNTAWHTLEENLHPSLETVDNIFLDFKSVWVDIVQLMGKAAALFDQIGSNSNSGATAAQNAAQRTLSVTRDQLQNRISGGGLTDTQLAGLQQQLDAIQAKLAPLEASQVPSAPVLPEPEPLPGIPLPKPRPDTAPKAKTDNSADAVQDAINSLNKHNEATQADAKAVGLGAAALAEYRAQAQETAAQQKNGGTITADQAAQFDKLKAAAAAAAQALAVAQVNSNISRGKQTGFLTPEDLQIANQLKSIYGDDIPAALNSSYAAALKFNDTIKTLGTLGQQVNEGVFTDLETQIRNGATAMQALQTAGVNALGKIADKLASMAADNLWADAFGGTGTSGLFGSLLKGITGGGSSTAALPAPGSGAFIGPVVAAAGGLINGPGTSTSDSIPARLSNGEYVVNASATSRYKSLLDSINSGKGFASGGYVGMPDIPSVQSSGSAAPIHVNTGSTINIQGSADQATLVLMQQMLAQRDAEMPAKVVQVVTRAKKQRLLA